MSFKRFTLPSLIATAALLSMGAAHAVGTATSNFNVLLTVKPKCIITNATVVDINLGGADVGATNVGSNTTFNMQCTKKTAYTITLAPTNTGAGTDNTGKLKGDNDATQLIDYALYSDAAYSTAWGKLTKVGGTSSTTSSAGVDFKVYAKVASVPDVPQDTYRDAVTITVTY